MTPEEIDLKALAESLVVSARKEGADEVEVSIGRGYEFTVEVRMGKIETLTEAGSRSLSLRVIKDKKTATASSEDLSEETLEALVESTIRRAEHASPDECAGLPEKEDVSVEISSLNLYDPEIPRLSADSKIRMAVETEKIGLSDKRITNSHGATFGTYEGTQILVNSKGFSGGYSATSCTLGLGLQAGDTDSRVVGSWFCSKRHFRELETPEEIARTCIRRTVRQLGARKIKTENVPVVLEPGMTSGLLGFLFSCVSGMAIYQKASFLAGKRGERVGNDLITVIDDGLMPGRLGSVPFDSEGVPARRTPVLEKGILKNYLCNTYAARKLKLRSTGNASGGGVGPHNFYLEPGPSTPEEIL
ncbi:MAG: TldD/PmbA family protein, partial [Candidatus Aminicenantales bacterium]